MHGMKQPIVILGTVMIAAVVVAIWYRGSGALEPARLRNGEQGQPSDSQPLAGAVTEPSRSDVVPGAPGGDATHQTDQAHLGAIIAWLRLPEGGPIAQGEVLLFDQEGKLEGAFLPRSERGSYGQIASSQVVASRHIDESGKAVFAHLRPGVYRVAADPWSLPANLLPSWDKKNQSIESERVELNDGRTATVTLHVKQGGTVFGQVFGPNNVPIAQAHVGAYATAPTERMQSTAVSDEDGSYALRLHEGEYAVGPMLALGSSFARFTAPPPTSLSIVPSSSVQVDFHFVDGSHSVAGTVLDQEGRPVPHLTVVAQYCRPGSGGDKKCMIGATAKNSSTDTLGRFEIEGLHPVPTAIQFGLGQRVLSAWLDPIALDLGRESKRVVLGGVVVSRSDRFCIEGKLLVDAELMRSVGLGMGDLEVQVEEERSGKQQVLGGMPRGDGSFRWACDHSNGPVVVRVHSKLGTAERRLVPRKSATEYLAIEYP